MVNHPPHYTSHPSGVECIDVTEHYNFCVGNAIKYLWRAGLKNDAIEDLKKARWYVDREIQRLTRGEPEAFSAPEPRQWKSLKDVADGVYVVFDVTGRQWFSYAGQSFWMTHQGPEPRDTNKAETDLSHLGPFTEVTEAPETIEIPA